jgi:hypothetical protein
MLKHPSDAQLLKWYDAVFDGAHQDDKSKPGVAHIRALREIWLKGAEAGERHGRREARRS